MRIIKILKYLLFVLLFLIITGVLLGYLYKDKVSNYVLSEINKSIDIPIEVKEIDFSFIKKFPNASIEFTGIFAAPSPEFKSKGFPIIKSDTLISVEKLFLSFSIIDIIRENYTLKEIQLDNGIVNLFVNTSGNTNYKFWKTNTDTTGKFSLKLEEIFFRDIKLNYFNLYKNALVSVYSKKLKLSGAFDQENYTLTTNGKLNVSELEIGGTNYLKSKNANLELKLGVDNNKYNIEQGVINVENMNLIATGYFITDDATTLDLKITGKDIDIGSFVSLLPDKYSEEIKKYKSNGDFYFESAISGSISHTQNAHVEASFGVSNADVTVNGHLFKKVFVEGRYTNGKRNSQATSSLILKNFSGKHKQSMLKGDFAVTSFKKPTYRLNAEMELLLEDLTDIINVDTIESLSGNLSGSFKSSGHLPDAEVLLTAFINNPKSGHLTAKEVKLKLEADEGLIYASNANVTIRDNNIICEKLSGKYHDYALNYEGEITGVFERLEDKKARLTITGKTEVEEIKILSGKSDSDNSGSFFPENVNIDVYAKLNTLISNNLVFKNINTNLKLFGNKLQLNNIMANAFEGEVLGDINFYEGINKNHRIVGNLSANKIDIEQLFYGFDNFGQDFITQKHLKGKANTRISFDTELNRNFDIDDNSLVANCYLKVTNGELNNFEPMTRLSKFIELSELKHITFTSFENEISIKDKKIVLPETEIKTSAFTLNAEGTHTFANEFEYRLKIYLDDFLFRKLRKPKNQDDWYVEDDGLGRTGVFVLVKGNIDDYKITYDRGKAKEFIKKSVKKEKKEVKDILNEEFGWFKKDSTEFKKKRKEEEKKKKEKENKKVQISWDDDF